MGGTWECTCSYIAEMVSKYAFIQIHCLTTLCVGVRWDEGEGRRRREEGGGRREEGGGGGGGGRRKREEEEEEEGGGRRRREEEEGGGKRRGKEKEEACESMLGQYMRENNYLSMNF